MGWNNQLTWRLGAPQPSPAPASAASATSSPLDVRPIHRIGRTAGAAEASPHQTCDGSLGIHGWITGNFWISWLYQPKNLIPFDSWLDQWEFQEPIHWRYLPYIGPVWVLYEAHEREFPSIRYGSLSWIYTGGWDGWVWLSSSFCTSIPPKFAAEISIYTLW